MYKTNYVCDCCGTEMTLPMYTLSLSTQSLCVQDRASWHYCDNCWENVKKVLTKKNESDDLEKAVEKLKEENKKLEKDMSWYKQFFMSMCKVFMNNLFCEQTGYGFTTSSDELLVGCCCENINSLDYK